MKIDHRTIEILKNFSKFDPGLIFQPGEYLYTTYKRNIRAKAKHSLFIEKEFAIADLNKLLGVINLFRDELPDVEVGERTLILTSGNKRVDYVFADPRLLEAVSTNDIQFNVDVSFKLQGRRLQEICGAASVLQHDQIILAGENGTLFFYTCNVENVTSDRYRIDLGQVEHTFTLVMQREALSRMIWTEDYTVSAGFKKIIRFENEKQDLEYLIAADARHSIVPL